MGARFVIERHADERGRHWGFMDSCPHGVDLGAIRLGPARLDERSAPDSLHEWDKLTWAFQDLGNGRCKISPSILAKGVHGGSDCHYGGGEFPFLWLEEGEYRNTEPFLTRYKAWIASLGP